MSQTKMTFHNFTPEENVFIYLVKVEFKKNIAILRTLQILGQSNVLKMYCHSLKASKSSTRPQESHFQMDYINNLACHQKTPAGLIEFWHLGSAIFVWEYP
ncbi:hypothetical protein CHS0354_022924 [Potamilus streckersoni]|uniref:Uncharacterized protein n=1 Tax=Potamilus streckersoni TaxID=2493646 RepID=A0AAE0S568_9BIVA|nr:hypothetical protein CHS0354_022924 [Potamilus streckersoni]